MSFSLGLVLIFTKHVLYNFGISSILIHKITFNINVCHFHRIVYVILCCMDYVFIYANFI